MECTRRSSAKANEVGKGTTMATRATGRYPAMAVKEEGDRAGYLAFCCRIASRMHLTCMATTDSTSTAMRLNSSKQPQAPVMARPLKIAPSDAYPIWSEQLNT